jgi:hypothetical protein
MFFSASDTNSRRGFCRDGACATNILVSTRQRRRVAQAALELCGSVERRDLVTFISIMSLNAELVAYRTSTPWKSRQHKRRFFQFAIAFPLLLPWVALIFQSTSVTKPQVNDLPFAGAATKIEKVWLFFL